MHKSLTSVLIAALLVLTALPALALEVSDPGTAAETAVDPVHFAARFKSFGNTGSGEVYVGVPDLGVGANRNESGHTWPTDGTESISVSYDPTADPLKVTATAGTDSVEYTLAAPPPAETPVNAIQIYLANREASATTTLSNVAVDGDGVTPAFVGAGNEFVRITDLDASDGVTFSADVDLAGAFVGGDELNKVEVQFGYVEPEDDGTGEDGCEEGEEPDAYLLRKYKAKVFEAKAEFHRARAELFDARADAVWSKSNKSKWAQRKIERARADVEAAKEDVAEAEEALTQVENCEVPEGEGDRHRRRHRHRHGHGHKWGHWGHWGHRKHW